MKKSALIKTKKIKFAFAFIIMLSTHSDEVDVGKDYMYVCPTLLEKAKNLHAFTATYQNETFLLQSRPYDFIYRYFKINKRYYKGFFDIAVKTREITQEEYFAALLNAKEKEVFSLRSDLNLSQLYQGYNIKNAYFRIYDILDGYKVDTFENRPNINFRTAIR